MGNTKAVSSFTTAFKTARTMQMVCKAKTVEWPGGLACLIAAQLKKKFMPDDSEIHEEAAAMLEKIKMKAHDDPAELFEQISVVEIVCADAKKKLDESTLVAHAIKAAPMAYASAIQSRTALGTRLRARNTLAVRLPQRSDSLPILPSGGSMATKPVPATACGGR